MPLSSSFKTHTDARAPSDMGSDRHANTPPKKTDETKHKWLRDEREIDQMPIHYPYYLLNRREQ